MDLNHLVIKFYYWLTANRPRPLPQTGEELLRLKAIFQLYYGLDESLESWVTVLGHIQSISSIKLKAPYSHLVNPGLRLKTNKLCQDEKVLRIQENQARLEEKLASKLKEVAESLEVKDDSGSGHDWTHNLETNDMREGPFVSESLVQGLPTT